MIENIEKIRITETSHPFATAFEKCGFQEKGYVEEEYFIHGLANVYGWEDGRKEVLFGDNPYTNRVIVRRPLRKEAFSKNVVVEILNSTSFMDFDRCWVLTYRHLMRNGDIYIGITSKPNVIPAMLKFDYDRYKRLSWKNPVENPAYEIADKDLGNMEGASSPETEDGLFWDMLTDLAKLLRDPKNGLIGENGPYYQYLAGWSQSGAYLIRFINDFAYEREQKTPYFDGYYSAGSASSCMPDLNQGYGRTAMRTSRRLKKVSEPFMEMHTESENVLWGNGEARGETGFADDMKYCIYDVPGATHDAKSTMIDYYMGDRDVFLSGIIPNYPGREIRPNDFPYEAAFQAALGLLYDWVREGREPFIAPAIETDLSLANVTDETGNAAGGFRLPFVDVPLCVYHPVSTPMKPDFAFACSLFGYVENYSREKALGLYGSGEEYIRRFTERLDECEARGLTLKADRQMCLDYAEKKAAEVFGGSLRGKGENMENENLEAMAFDLRKHVLQMIVEGKGGHIGGDMSVMEILCALYFVQMNISPENRDDPDRDRFIMSKGHCVEALYAVLAAKGFFPVEEVIAQFSKFGSDYIGHPNNQLNGIEMNSGSLGHGLPVAVGMALAGKMDKRDYRVYTVMGDGELAEGSVWEAAMAAHMYRLDNLCAVIDRNRLQISGNTEEVMALDGLAEKWTGFGWHVVRADGNNIGSLNEAFEEARRVKEKPTVVIADTVKGYGSAVMENQAAWHHRVPSAEELKQILKDFAEKKEALLHE